MRVGLVRPMNPAIITRMRKVWRWVGRSETTLGLVLLVVALAGAGVVVNWMSAADDGCTARATAAICDDSLKDVVVPVSVFGTIIFCAVSVIGVKWSSLVWMRRWTLIGLLGELACLAAGAALAATGP
jgi:ABC-type transport system involved in cytochrome c biogenesis permease subunit